MVLDIGDHNHACTMLGKKVSRSLAFAACPTGDYGYFALQLLVGGVCHCKLCNNGEIIEIATFIGFFLEDDKYWTIYQIRLDNNINVGAHKPHMGGGMLAYMVEVKSLCFPYQLKQYSLELGYLLPNWPPSTFKSSPVTKPESSDARKSTALATSPTFNTTPFKVEVDSEIFSTCSASFPNAPHDIGVATTEGETQFTLIPCCPSCTLAARTRPSTACFDMQ
ncbi:hypothetical protein CFP56_013676 [Quercus suber]|uniref:Uncharacterized protein n=1 Tax=Quercus suber TaxID=58331 RepID=A0AAW0KVA8_QUESU